MPPDVPAATPRVAAILVVHDGEEWLPAALSTIAAQDYPALDLVVVDNASSDGSSGILRRRVPEERRISLRRNTGFGRALNVALRHELAAGADYVLLLHDDLLLAPDTVTRLVAAMVADDQLAVVGPKLREWDEEPILQQVGMSVDVFGRAESGLERGELDQGQADRPGDTLYVSTAGMLVRAEVYRELRGFDPRMSALRDDLDFCWRAWLAGWRVGIVPDAIGYHVAAGSRGARPLWYRRTGQSRYLSERHALATVLKCYGWVRLIWVVPLLALIGAGKVLAFLMTRRFVDAGATVRAYVWNISHLPRTVQLRRRVQRERVRSDADLRPLFAAGLPRVAEYVHALSEWLAGGDTPAILTEPAVAPYDPTTPSSPALVRFVREHPIASAGGALAVAYLIGALPLLGEGQLIGGDVLPWPAGATDLLAAYVSPLGGQPLAGGAVPSPVQAVLGVLALLGMGSAWLAQRLLVLGLLPLAWLTALRAGRLVTFQPAPRVLGATLYVLSPVVIGTLASGRIGDLVLAALLPAVVLLTARAAGPRTPLGTAWRATALLVLVAATAVAASPGGGLVVTAVLVGGLVASLWPGAERLGRPSLRMGFACVWTAVLLAPWLWALVAVDGVSLPDAGSAPIDAWRAFLLTPMLSGGPDVLVVLAAAVVTGAVLILALLLGLRLRPLPVAALLAAFVLAATAAWAVGRLGPDWVSTDGLLIGSAAALAGLAVVAARTFAPALRARTFGAVQVLVVVSAVVLVGGLFVGVWRAASGPWEGVAPVTELVPAFVGGEVERVGPYRVLLLEADVDEAVVGDASVGDAADTALDDEDVDVTLETLRWTVTESHGATIAQLGRVPNPVLVAAVEDALEAAAVGDPDAGGVLGRLNVRYIVMDDNVRATVGEVLRRQPGLDPLAAGGGQVLRVRSWLPRAAALDDEVVARVLGPGTPGDLTSVEESGLRRIGEGLHEEVPIATGGLVVAEESRRVQASVRGRPLPRLDVEADVPIAAFELPARAGLVRVEPRGLMLWWMVVAGQALVALGMLSLLLRPPRFAVQAEGRASGRAPAALLVAEHDVVPAPAPTGSPRDGAEGEPDSSVSHPDPTEPSPAPDGGPGESASAEPGKERS